MSRDRNTALLLAVEGHVVARPAVDWSHDFNLDFIAII